MCGKSLGPVACLACLRTAELVGSSWAEQKTGSQVRVKEYGRPHHIRSCWFFKDLDFSEKRSHPFEERKGIIRHPFKRVALGSGWA